MRPDRNIVKVENAAYVAGGVTGEWVPVNQKMGLITVESLKNAATGNLFNDLCDMNKKHKLGLTNPTMDDIKKWIAKNEE